MGGISVLNNKNLDFKDIIDITVLQDIQDKFGMITGVSFITVDFR
ncbi:MAG: hypothetical protein ACJAX4_000762 [Clostridium sp.]|jgi:hypothetical protein